MRKKILLGVGALIIGLLGIGYLNNEAPVAAAVGSQAQARPYVVKMHAQWCPICMATKGVWSQIAGEYGGRVHVVVFDLTNDVSTAASRIEATRLGLEKYFDENARWKTGTISVLNAKGEELASARGNRTFQDYRTAIDAALAPSR